MSNLLLSKRIAMASITRVFRRSMSTSTKGGVLTLVGGSGFVGKEVIRQNSVTKDFDTVRIVSRDASSSHADAARKVGDEYGVAVDVVTASVRDMNSLVAAFDGSKAVVNLVGIIYETSEESFYEAHERAALSVSGAISAVGTERAVHVSALGVSQSSESKYLLSKAFAEDAFQAKLPNGTVLRPSVIFGKDDHVSHMIPNLMRMFPAFPLFGGGSNRVQPVYVGDVAKAILKCSTDAGTGGKVYELGGPDVFSWEGYMKELQKYSGVSRPLVPVPYVMGEFVGGFLGLLPEPPLTRDQVLSLKYDNTVDASAPNLSALGIHPVPMAEVMPGLY